MPKKGKDQYEDFYERLFNTKDIDEILDGGAVQLSLNNFRIKSKEVMPSDIWEIMFQHPHARGEKKSKLGKVIYQRYFEDIRITQNKVNRIIVRKGETIRFQSKIYKGGTFIPKTFFKK